MKAAEKQTRLKAAQSTIWQEQAAFSCAPQGNREKKQLYQTVGHVCGPVGPLYAAFHYGLPFPVNWAPYLPALGATLLTYSFPRLPSHEAYSDATPTALALLLPHFTCIIQTSTTLINSNEL